MESALEPQTQCSTRTGGLRLARLVGRIRRSDPSESRTMIQSVELRNSPCFDSAGVTLGPLTAFNFVFGGNGSGKTTISRALADNARFPGTSVSWGGTAVSRTVRVYNLDYVRSTFGAADADLPGVFLLGAASREVHAEISEVETQLELLENQMVTWTASLGDANLGTGKLGQVKSIRDELAEAGWQRRDSVPAELQVMFEGFRGSKAKFLDQVLSVSAAHDSTDGDLESLVSEATSVFDATAIRVDPLVPLSFPSVHGSIGADLFGVPVVGSSDVAIAALIEELRNSDWVRQGRDFLGEANGLCPFCQQPAPHDLAEQLSEYFDARYTEQLNKLQAFSDWYGQSRDSARAHLDQILAQQLPQLEESRFSAARARLDLVIEENARVAQAKIEQPSSVLELVDVVELVAELNSVIAKANIKIDEHNALVDNRAQAGVALVARAWRSFVRGALAAEVASYEARITGETVAIKSLKEKIDLAAAEIREKRSRLRELQSQVTSSLPIITEINRLLESVGFYSFHLAESRAVADGYELVRADGSRVDDTLSEGERTFITFLYFCHQLQGIHLDPSESAALVAVIDDPISSLDSDILFVVSSLVRRLMTRIRNGDGRVEQLVLLTHNVHFHKEVTYVRNGEPTTGRSFFVVKKRAGQNSELVSCGERNPVRTVYKSLWDEVAKARLSPDEASIGIQNVMRRILENYFRILGSINDEAVVAYFEGEQQLVCRSLLGWVNEGSHSIIEELDFSPTEASTRVFLDVFELIFVHSGNQGHYDMMIASD